MIKNLTLSFFLVCFINLLQAQTNIYVDASRASNGNGSTWATAYKDLNEALKYANETDGAFDIHVAKGTYKPTDATLRGAPYSSDNVTYSNSIEGGFEDGITFAFAAYEYSQSGNLNEFYPHVETNYQSSSSLGARDVAFSIKGPGIRMFGGYPTGGGTRDFSANPTYLDGNLGDANSSGDNAYHVMLIGIGADNYMSTDSIVVDGFTIKNGNANGTGSARCNGYGVAQNQGGGIYNIFETVSGNTSVVSIRNCTLSNNYAYFGGGIFNETCNGTFSNCTFSSNSCKSGGAAMYINGASPKIKNCSFTSNSSRFFGGGIFAASTTATINNSTFSSNVADSSASCLYITQGGPQLNNCNFSSNLTYREAGAIRADFCNMTIAGCSFTSNSASKMCGALLSMKSNLTVSNSTFTSNTAAWRSGALWMRGKKTTAGSTFTNCTFQSNTTTNTADLNHGWGGAILADSSASTTFSSCTFKSNSSKRGGLYFTQASANLTFTDCIIQSNTSSYGSGIGKSETSSVLTFNSCKILDNTCTSNGQSITGWGESGSLIVNNDLNGASTLNINNTLISGNRVDSTGSSGIIMNFANLNVNNSVFVNNHTKSLGAGVYNEGSNAVANIISCTFNGNTTLYNNSIFNAFSGTLKVRNTINNDGYYGYYQQNATYDAAYSYFNGSSSTIGGTGNIFNVGPGFANTGDLDGADNLWRTSDDGLNLSNTSSCRNTGFNSYSSALTSDFAGNSRLNGVIDMGAYEWVTVTPANVLTFDGNNDHIVIPFFSRPNEYTIEARIKTTSTALQSIMFFGGTNQIRFGIQSGKLVYSEFGPAGGFEVGNQTTINDGQWHHVAVVRNGTAGDNIKLYVDGVLSAQGNLSQTLDLNKILIGSWDGWAEMFNGQMDEVRFWNRALCGGELSQNKGCEISTNSGLLAYYKFNQGNSGAANAAQTSLVDASSNNRNGTLTNFDLAGTNNWMQVTSGVSTTSCGAFSAPTVTASNNGPAITGGSLSLTAGNGFSSYAWAGPNGYSSALQNPSISNIQTNAAGTYTVNASQNGCNATATTNVTVNSNPASALAFDGTDFVSVPHIQLGSEFTIEAKFKTGASGGANPIVGWEGPNAIYTSLYITSNGSILFYKQNGGAVEYYTGTQTQTFNDNQWHHIAVSQFNNNIKVYIDGSLLYSYNGWFASMPTTSTLRLGEFNNWLFNGQLDEFRLWNRALCNDEISNSKNCEISSTSNGLAIYYRFNHGYHNADNTATTTVTDLAGGDQNGTLTNFSLSGTSSNWILSSGTGSTATGTSCTVFNAPNLNAVISNGTTIVNGDNTPSTSDNTDFGIVNNAVTTSKNFTVTNNGAGALTISGITVTGTDANSFSLVNIPTTIAANSSAIFKVNFIPAGTSVAKNATITINSSDCRNTPYTFAVKATGILLTPGAALNFDGTNDYISLPTLNITNTFTIEAKIKSTTTDRKTIVNLYGAYPESKTLGMYNGYLTYIDAVNGQNIWAISTTQVNDGNWHHVAVVHTGASSNNVTLYIDGVNVGIKTSTVNPTTTVGYIGAWGGFAEFFPGDIDEVRIWNTALCGMEIANASNCEISATATNLAAYYKFNQGNAANDNIALSTLADATTNAKNGTFNGFTLNGASSNFVANGGVVTGTSCGSFQPATIAVTNATNINISNNDNTPSVSDNTDFENLDINANPLVTTFTLKNSGTGTLTLNGTTKVIVTGTGFSLNQDASASVAPNGSTTFKIAFDPNVTGAHTGTVTIYSNDCNNSTFTFSIQGNGIGGPPTAFALNFDGSNDYIEKTGVTGLPLGNAARTMEAWFKTTAVGATQSIINYGTQSSNSRFGVLLQPAGNVYFVGENNDLQGTGNYDDGNWHHVAVVYTGGSNGLISVYVDGVLNISSVKNLNTSGSSVRVGQRLAPGGGEFFNGSIDEVRIYNYALCLAEIQNHKNAELGNATNGLVLYYQFNQGQNGGANSVETIATDASGNNNNGTLTNFNLTGSVSNWVAPGAITAGIFAPIYTPAEISVTGGGSEIVSGTSIPSVTDFTDFGNVQQYVGTKSQTYTISNLGVGNLTLSGSPKVTVTGTGFALTTDAGASTISPNSSASFTITFTAPASGIFTGSVTISNNDCDESSYTFAIKATSFAPPISQALNFDGSNDYVQIPKSVTSDFTIEYWMKTTMTGNTICNQWYCGDGIVDAEVGGVTNDFGTALLGSKLAFGVGNPDYTIVSTSDVNNGQWIHVAATYIQSNGEVKLYINGALEASGISGATALRSAPTRIVLGVLQTGLRYFSGTLDEVRIWDRALCQEEISNYKNCEIFNSPSNLKQYYRFNDYVGDLINTGNTTLVDHSGNTNNGTLSNFALNGTTSNFTSSSVIVPNMPCAPYSKPIISVLGNSISIPNNSTSVSTSNNTDFGYTAVGSNKNVQFTVANTGTINNLVLSGIAKVTVSGAGFSLQTDAIATISAGASTNFTVNYAPTTVGTHTATITIYSNDCATPVYTYIIQGNSIPAAALNFNGDYSGDDIVNVGNSMNSVLGTLNRLTVEAMVYPTDPTFNGVIVGNYSTPNNELQFLLRRDGMEYTFFIDDGAGYHGIMTTGNQVQLNTWQHVAGVWDGSELKLYLNGILLASAAGYTGQHLNSNVTNYVSIGSNANSFEPFWGSIDEVRIWSRDLCVTEIQHNMNAELRLPQSGLLAYYQFNQGGAGVANLTETTLTDASGNGYNGTLTGMTLTDQYSNWIAPGAVASGINNGIYFPAEIEITGNSAEIASGDLTPSLNDNTDFGSVLVSGTNSVSKTFTIKNTGNKVLLLTGSPRVTVTGTDFTLTTDATATINPASSASFTVNYDPSTDGISNGTILIANDDCDESAYTFSMQGTGRNPESANALHFDGTDDYVAVTNPFYQYSDALTVEWHVNIESATPGSGIGQGTSNVDNASTNVWLMHFNSNNSISFGANNNGFNSGYAYYNSLTSGWHHIVGVATQAATKLYVDGQLVNVGPGFSGTQITNNAASELHFGKDVRYANGRFFQGKMDEVRIWNRVLSATEINHFSSCERNAAIDNPNGLVGYYKFDQGLEQSDNSTVVTLADSSVFAHNGTLNNFTLNGLTSNWVNESPVSIGNYCAPCTVSNNIITVNECSASSYLSPSGRYTWTADGTYNDTLISQLGCDSIITVNLTFNNLNHTITYNPPAATFCGPGQSTQFEVLNSQANVTYELLDMADSSSLAVVWGGSALQFNTGFVNSTRTYGLRVSKNGCSLILNDLFVATIKELPNTSISVDRTNIFSQQIGGTYQWIDCANSNAQISGETTSIFTPPANGNYAVVVTSPSGCTDTSNCIVFTPPVPASALNFDGINDYVNVNYAIPTTNFTMELWFKTTTPNGGLIEANSNGHDRSIALFNGDIGTYLWPHGNDGLIYTSGTNYADGIWHHIAYVASAAQGGQKLYVDGILKGTATASVSGFTWNTHTLIGYSEFDNVGYFNGTIDQVRIWERALTQEQIVNKMHCQINQNLTGLALNYNFNQGDSAGANQLVTYLQNSNNSSASGSLNNFFLSGNESNWIAPGADANSSSCQTCITQFTTQNVTTCGEAYVSPSGLHTWTASGTYVDTVYTANSCDSIITINLINNGIDTAVTRSGNMLTSHQPNATYRWLDCSNAGAEITGATNQTYSPLNAGIYAVEITRGSCIDTSNCINYAPLPPFIQEDCIPTVGNNDMFRSVVSDDFNGDGYKDLMGRDDYGITHYYTNDGNGNFSAGIDLFPAGSFYSLASHDLDNDGDVDLVVYNNTIHANIYMNDGTGTFTLLPGVNLMNGTGYISVVKFGDINGDGNVDIVTGNSNFSLATDMNEVWINNGSVGNASFTYLSGVQNNNGGRNSIDLGDIDGDGDKDLVTGGGSWPGYVYKNDGSGAFSLSQTFNEYSGGIRFLDWDNDGDLDKVNYDNYNTYGLRVSFNDGAGNFSFPSTQIITSPTSNNCVVADLNGDNNLDLVFDSWGGNAIVYLNTGCNFVLQPDAINSNASHGIDVDDFNNDGKPDVFCLGREANSCFHYNNLETTTSIPSTSVTTVVADSSCGTAILTLSAEASNNGGLNWFNVPNGGSVLNTGNVYVTGTLANSATYYVEAVNAVGCKSARVEVLASIYDNPTLSIAGNPNTVICPGESVTLTASSAATYIWNNGIVDNTAFTAFNTTTYQVTGTDVHGCSSSASTIVNVSSTQSTIVNASICEGSTYMIGVNSYDATGNYTIMLNNSNGCDSLVVLNLTVNTPSVATDIITACDSYTWIDGNTYSSSNSIATHTLNNAAGCDSVVTLNLTINHSTAGTDVITACDSYTWIDGNTYNTSNSSATFMVQNSMGCDSLITLNLTINTTLNAGTDSTANVCSNVLQTVDLFDYLGGNFATGGTWNDNDNTGQLAGNIFTTTSVLQGQNYNFTYTISNTVPCSNTSATVTLFVDICGNISMNEISAISIYPNPTNGILNITNAENGKIEIFNIIGEKLQLLEVNQCNGKLDLTSYAPGNYIVKVITNKYVVAKIITRK